MDKGNCSNCERLQSKVDGDASPRTKYVQPTMYDHMSNFVDFQNAIRFEHEVKEHRKQLLTLHENFTDLKLVGNNEDVPFTRNISTQNLLKFNNDLKSGAFHYEPKAIGPEDLWEQKNKAVKPSESLTNISRSPIQCPVKKCNQTVGITSVLLHFLRDHIQDYPVDCQEIFHGRQSLMLFKENIFEHNENLCLGLLPYGGHRDNPDTRPGLSGICRPNSFLFGNNQCLVNHLPIVIMACKTSLNYLIEDKHLAGQLADPTDRNKDILVIWLSTVETTCLMHCTITVFNTEMTTSRSTIVEIRNLRDSQDPNSFLSKDANYLMLSRAEIDLLSSGENKQIKLEILVHDFMNNSK